MPQPFGQETVALIAAAVREASPAEGQAPIHEDRRDLIARIETAQRKAAVLHTALSTLNQTKP